MNKKQISTSNNVYIQSQAYDNTKSQESQPLLTSSYYQNNFNSGYDLFNKQKKQQIISHPDGRKHNDQITSDNQAQSFIRAEFRTNGQIPRQKQQSKRLINQNSRHKERKKSYNSSQNGKLNNDNSLTQQNKTTKQKSYKRPTNQKAFYQIQINDQTVQQRQLAQKQIKNRFNLPNHPKTAQFMNCNDFISNVILPLASKSNEPHKSYRKAKQSNKQQSFLNQFSEIQQLQIIVLKTLKQKQSNLQILSRQIQQLQQQKLYQFHRGQQLESQLLKIKRQRQKQENIDWERIGKQIKQSNNFNYVNKYANDQNEFKPKNAEQAKLVFEYQRVVQELQKINKQCDNAKRKQKQSLKEEILLKQNLKTAFKARRQFIKSLSKPQKTEHNYRCQSHQHGRHDNSYSRSSQYNRNSSQSTNKYAPYYQKLTRQNKNPKVNAQQESQKQNSINLSNQIFYQYNNSHTRNYPTVSQVSQTQILLNLVKQFKEIKQKVNKLDKQKKLEQASTKTTKKRKAVSFLN